MTGIWSLTDPVVLPTCGCGQPPVGLDMSFLANNADKYGADPGGQGTGTVLNLESFPFLTLSPWPSSREEFGALARVGLGTIPSCPGSRKVSLKLRHMVEHAFLM